MIILSTLTMACESEAFFCSSAPVHWCTSALSVTVLGINIIHIAVNICFYDDNGKIGLWKNRLNMKY